MILTRFSSAPITKYAENVLVVPLVVLTLLFFFCSFRFRSASVGGCVWGGDAAIQRVLRPLMKWAVCGGGGGGSGE